MFTDGGGPVISGNRPAIRAAHRASALDHYPGRFTTCANDKADALFGFAAILTDGLIFVLHFFNSAFSFHFLFPPFFLDISDVYDILNQFFDN
jgi:hypothetical protein